MLPKPHRAVSPYLRRLFSIHRSVTRPVAFCNRSSSRWCWHGWTTAAQLLLVCRVSYSKDVSPSCITQPLDWCPLSGSTIMSLRFWATFTGCMHRRESNTVWRHAGVPLSTWKGSFVPDIGAPACVWHYLLRSLSTALVVPWTKRSTSGRTHMEQSVAGCVPSHRLCL